MSDFNSNDDNKKTPGNGWDFSKEKKAASQERPLWEDGKHSQDSYSWDYDSLRQADNASRKPGKSKGLVVFASLMCSVLVVGLLTLSGFGLYSILSQENPIQQAEDQAPSQNGETQAPSLNNKPSGGNSDIISADGKLTPQQIAKKTLPTVVGIVNYRAGNNLMGTTQGEGSGIILTEDGYIVTNAHVIQGAVGLKVVTHDGEEYAAQVVGSDERSDLAVIKIEAEGLPYAELGNSDELEIGEPVIAVGNPGGLILAGSVTDGIVSALNRPINTQGSDTINCIQTNAAINPGNSGGALVNQYGQVIGINSSKIVYEGYEGLGFAIAINEAQPIIEDLMKYGMVTGRVKIGVTIVEVDAYLARLNNLPTGIYVQGVDSNSDAMARGVVPGDVITHVNGTRVETLQQVRAIIDDFEAGDEVTLTIYRVTKGYESRELDIAVRLMEDVPVPAASEAVQQ